MRYHQEIEGDNGWSQWIPPKMRGYRMICCDCGLVHTMELRVIRVVKQFKDGSRMVKTLPARRYRVEMRAQRNNRATAAVRRKKR